MIPALTNHVWQSTLFAIVAGLLTVAFRTNRAQLRYWLWFCASLKFLVPFSLLMSLGSHLEWAPAARRIALQIAAPSVSFTMAQISQPFPDGLTPSPSTGGTHAWAPIALFGVWACGFSGVALIRFRGWLRIRDAVRSSTPIDIPATVAVRAASLDSGGLLEPGVVGLWRPILLLPAGIVERLTPCQLEAVLAHELCHVRRRDNLTSAIHMIVEALFWFHPLVWWVGARLLEERERSCDEEVLRLGSEPRVYAEGILNVCKMYVESPLACVSGVTGSNLEKRIEAIMTNRIALSLNFTKRLALAVVGMAALVAPIVVGVMNAPSIRAQAGAAATPKFEVASIKPSKDCEGGGGAKKGVAKGGGGASPGRLNVCASVEDLINGAYVVYASGYLNRQAGLSRPPISGGPAWLQSAYYRINAKAESTPSEGMMRGPMMQALLEERFKLKIRRENREVPAYALTVAKNGPKLQPFKAGSCTPSDPTLPWVQPPPGQKNCMVGFLGGKGPNVTLEAQAVSLDHFSKMLGWAVERPVIDKTGITGRFDFHLEFAIDEATPRFLPGSDPPGPPATPSDVLAAPSILTVVQQQLGLKLEAAKGPREFLVIDRVERPTEN